LILSSFQSRFINPDVIASILAVISDTTMAVSDNSKSNFFPPFYLPPLLVRGTTSPIIMPTNMDRKIIMALLALNDQNRN